jgi:hypothetical protein
MQALTSGAFEKKWLQTVYFRLMRCCAAHFAAPRNPCYLLKKPPYAPPDPSGEPRVISLGPRSEVRLWSMSKLQQLSKRSSNLFVGVDCFAIF